MSQVNYDGRDVPGRSFCSEESHKGVRIPTPCHSRMVAQWCSSWLTTIEKKGLAEGCSPYSQQVSLLPNDTKFTLCLLGGLPPAPEAPRAGQAQRALWGIFPHMWPVHCDVPAHPHQAPLTAGSLTQQEKGTPQRSRLGFKSVQLK